MWVEVAQVDVVPGVVFVAESVFVLVVFTMTTFV